eukprot:8102956-Lingulodinium_polyedra.AAC.2
MTRGGLGLRRHLQLNLQPHLQNQSNAYRGKTAQKQRDRFTPHHDAHFLLQCAKTAVVWLDDETTPHYGIDCFTAVTAQISGPIVRSMPPLTRQE